VPSSSGSGSPSERLHLKTGYII